MGDNEEAGATSGTTEGEGLVLLLLLASGMPNLAALQLYIVFGSFTQTTFNAGKS